MIISLFVCLLGNLLFDVSSVDMAYHRRDDSNHPWPVTGIAQRIQPREKMVGLFEPQLYERAIYYAVRKRSIDGFKS